MSTQFTVNSSNETSLEISIQTKQNFVVWGEVLASDINQESSYSVSVLDANDGILQTESYILGTGNSVYNFIFEETYKIQAAKIRVNFVNTVIVQAYYVEKSLSLGRMKINQEIHEIKNAWIKKDGVWRNISTFYFKKDGIWKDVGNINF